MTEREKKQQQWQKAQREQKSQQRTRSRWLKILCSILWSVGLLCGIAALVVGNFFNWLVAAISLIYLWLVLWTCAAWLNWYLAPDGYILRRIHWGISRFTWRMPNLWAAIGMSILSVLMFLILL